MAGGSLLMLLDDIAAILDDVSVMTKVAAKKTAGVLGDDLALNAQQVTGVRADRELAVVWGVAKGSLINKLILVPAALLISAIAAWLITPLLMLGGAIRTDFILSAEIVVISLGVMTAATFTTKAAALSAIAIMMTVGVYGLVALIVKLDDMGIYLVNQPSAYRQAMGRTILAFAPRLMKFLSFAGTLAMFLVGGGILVHGVGILHHQAQDLAALSGVFGGLTEALYNGMTGLIAGLMILVGVIGVKKFIKQ